MDSLTNKGKNNVNRKQGHEWEASSFDWENMKEGIFEKIVTEDPRFFGKKRRRKLVFWIRTGAAMVLFSAGIIWAATKNKAVDKTEFIAQFESQLLQNTDAALTNKTSSIELSSSSKIQGTKLDQTSSFENSSITIGTENNKSGIDTINSFSLDLITPKAENTQTQQPTSHSDQSTIVYSLTLASQMINNKANKQVYFSYDDSQKVTIATPVTGSNRSLVEFAQLHPISIHEINSPYPRPAINELIAPMIYENNKKVRDKTTWNTALLGGALISFSRYKGSSSIVDIRNDNTSASFGFQYGLVASATFPSKYFLIFDLNRNITYQNIDVSTVRAVDVELEGALLAINHFVVGDRTSFRYGDTTVAGLEQNRLVNYNSLKSLNGGIGIGRTIAMHAWAFSSSVGVSFGLITSVEGYTVAEDQSIFFYDKENPIHNSFQFSTWVGFEFTRQISDRISLLMGYRFDKQWNNASVEKGLVLRPAYHRLTIGASLKF